MQHPRRLAKAKVSSPTPQVFRQGGDHAGQVCSLGPSRQETHPSFEPLERFRRDVALHLPLASDAEAEKTAFTYRRHGALGLIDL